MINQLSRWNSFSAVCLLGCLFTVAGCGYSTRSLLPGTIKTIHIDHFKNKITYAVENRRNLYIPLLEVKVRNAVIDRFLFNGRLRVEDSETADLVLKGSLLGYERDVLRYTDNNDPLEYRIRIIISMELWDTEKEKTLWAEPSFSGEATFFVSGAQAKSESTALEDALVDLARRIVERTIEDW